MRGYLQKNKGIEYSLSGDLQEAVVEAINQLISESSELKAIIKENIEKAITGNGSSRIKEIDKEIRL